MLCTTRIYFLYKLKLVIFGKEVVFSKKKEEYNKTFKDLKYYKGQS